MKNNILLLRIDRLVDAFGEQLRWLCLWITLGTFIVVMVRYLLQSGQWLGLSLTAVQESVMMAHAALFMLAAAYTLRHDEHVRVDVFYRRFSPRQRAWVEVLGTLLLLLPMATLILITSLEFVEVSWLMRERSREADGLPGVYALKALIPVSAGLLIAQGLIELWRHGRIALGATVDTGTEKLDRQGGF